MNPIINAALAVAAATGAPHAGAVSVEPPAVRWANVVEAARRMDVSATRLRRALSAPPMRSRQLGEPRYCLRLTSIDPATDGTLCRTRADWQSLGMEPVEG